jgi:hypothetical protein
VEAEALAGAGGPGGGGWGEGGWCGAGSGVVEDGAAAEAVLDRGRWRTGWRPGQC